VSANYLEALERWDTGAVQCLCAQGIPRPWFWVAGTCMLVTYAVILVPAWYPLGIMLEIDSWDKLLKVGTEFYLYPEIDVVIAAAAWWFVIGFIFLIIACRSRIKTNYLLRMCILLFNHTYPLNSVSAIFWIIIPPWICLTGAFPFRFDPVFAIIGSLVLRIVEWMIVMRTKKESEKTGTKLQEYSIFRSQQMNEVTVPIKLRACLIGFQTGYKDVFGKEDNSFWTSFGTAQAVVWVQTWLCFCMLAMIMALIGGTLNMFLHWGETNVLTPCVFGIVLAFIQFWILIEPTLYVMKDRRLKASLRHTEVLVLIAIGAAVVFMSQGQRLGLFNSN
jgi:hypothetical protein